MNLDSIYYNALEGAIEAGRKISSIYKKQSYEIEVKKDESPVTIADKSSSAIISNYLKKTNYPVIDEEQGIPSYDERKDWKYFWLVDPMDGTKEFISGNGEFTVNIALIEDSVPVFGVIYTPTTGQLFWGDKILGSYKLDEIFHTEDLKLQWDHAKKLLGQINQSEKLTIAASRSHMDKSTEDFIEKLKNKLGELNYINKGSSLKLCMIAEGTAHVYPRFSRTMEWDTAAGHAIILGSGGSILQKENMHELVYNKKDLANPPFIAVAKGIDIQCLP
jgi:3'(2'), 5'-bisphosphate nucleotidase